MGAAVSLVMLQAPAVAGDDPGATSSGSSPAQPEVSLAGDGPVVVQADPFSMDTSGLAAGQIEMTTVSTRPTLVTGDEARVQVRGLQPDDGLAVQRDGTDVSAGFVPVASRPGQGQGIREGLVRGLKVGANHLVATASDQRFGTRGVTLTVVDHPIQGPVISGPHQEPFVCGTAAAGLGAAGPDCTAPTNFAWYARMMSGQWQQLSDPYGSPPAGTEYVQCGGRSVPFMVRIESAVINRSITRIALLDDPQDRGPSSAFTPGEWNHNLLYQFGESCGTGFHQGSNQASDAFAQLAVSASDLAGPVLDLTGHLKEGWMFAESTLTTFGVSCNPLTSAETLMMVKEHVVDEYGDVFHAVGAGGPVAMDNIDCQLRPAQASDYPATVTPAELQQIKGVFADGVCDYSAQPVGWVTTSSTWLYVGGTAEVWPPQPVPYPLARSVVPMDHGLTGGPVPSPTSAPTPTLQALDQLVGPPSPIQDSLAAPIRTVSTIADGLP